MSCLQFYRLLHTNILNQPLFPFVGVVSHFHCQPYCITNVPKKQHKRLIKGQIRCFISGASHLCMSAEKSGKSHHQQRGGTSPLHDVHHSVSTTIRCSVRTWAVVNELCPCVDLLPYTDYHPTVRIPHPSGVTVSWTAGRSRLRRDSPDPASRHCWRWLLTTLMRP